jgi:hypothetical protein
MVLLGWTLMGGCSKPREKYAPESETAKKTTDAAPQTTDGERDAEGRLIPQPPRSAEPKPSKPFEIIEPGPELLPSQPPEPTAPLVPEPPGGMLPKPSLPIEEPKVEQPKVEQPKVEEPKVEEPKPEVPKPKDDMAATPAEAPTPSPIIPESPAAPAAVTPSAFAPAEDLVNQLEAYLKQLKKAIESEAEYKDAQSRLSKDVNTLIVIALALGLHDQDNKYKAAAAGVVKAAQQLAAATDYEATKAGVEAVAKALETPSGDSASLKWEKVASLAELMKAVPLISRSLKRYVEGPRFAARAKDTTGYSAVLATIAQASIADTSLAKSAEEVQQWITFCEHMRQAAAAVNANIRLGDQEATSKAIERLDKSCDDCHAVFHKEALNQPK